MLLFEFVSFFFQAIDFDERRRDNFKANEILINRLIDLFSKVYSSLTKKEEDEDEEEEEEEHFHIFSITRSTDPCERNLNE